jgi:integrase
MCIFTSKKEAATADIMQKLIATCNDGSMKDVRDAALLSVAFSSGGSRRSEIVSMEYQNLHSVPGGYSIKLYFSKGRYEGTAKEFPIKGMAAEWLTKWLEMSGIKAGPLFRSVRNNCIGDGLNAKAVNQIFKERMKLAGIECDYSAHSIKSGFVTSAASSENPIPIWEIMAMTGHKTSRSVDDYYRSGSILKNPASDML